MASVLKVDTITGVSTAGSIAVTGEGNSTTTNLQQGLAKAWVRFNADSSNSINDSLNVGTIRDNGTGQHGLTLTNPMNNTDWAVVSTGTAAGTNGGTIQLDSSAWMGSGTSPYRTTTEVNLRGIDNDTSNNDDHKDANVVCFGDLA